MARPVYDTITNSTTTNASSGSFNHTVASGGMLLVAVSWYDRTGVAATSVSSLTYNGAALTFAGRARQNFATNDYVTTEIWYINSPSTGSAYSVAWTLSEANDSGDAICVSAISVTGASNGIGATVGTATGNSTGPSVTFTTQNTEGLIIVAVGQLNIASTPYTPGAGETERADGGQTGSGSMSYWVAESNATAGSDTVSATSSTSARWGIVAVEVLPAAATAVSNPPRRQRLMFWKGAR